MSDTISLAAQWGGRTGDHTKPLLGHCWKGDAFPSAVSGEGEDPIPHTLDVRVTHRSEFSSALLDNPLKKTNPLGFTPYSERRACKGRALHDWHNFWDSWDRNSGKSGEG